MVSRMDKAMSTHETGLLITPAGSQVFAAPANGREFTLEELQNLVGGSVERKGLGGDRAIYFDEEGWLKDLPSNTPARALLNLTFVPVGNVLLVVTREDAGKPEPPELTPTLTGSKAIEFVNAHNAIKVLAVEWRTGGTGTVGMVAIAKQYGFVAYMGVAYSGLETDDIELIRDYGVRMREEEARPFFPSLRELMYMDERVS